MSSTSVSVLIPLTGPAPELPSTLETVEQYLLTTGFEFDVRVLDSHLPYPVNAIGDAVALIESGSAEVVFGNLASTRHVLLRLFLVPILPDPTLRLKAFSSDAARLLIAESKLSDGGFDLEVAYLANKYGFRIESLRVNANGHARPSFGAISGLQSAIAIRLMDRNNGYRAPRRCPVCFS